MDLNTDVGNIFLQYPSISQWLQVWIWLNLWINLVPIDVMQLHVTNFKLTNSFFLCFFIFVRCNQTRCNSDLMISCFCRLDCYQLKASWKLLLQVIVSLNKMITSSYMFHSITGFCNGWSYIKKLHNKNGWIYMHSRCSIICLKENEDSISEFQTSD